MAAFLADAVPADLAVAHVDCDLQCRTAEGMLHFTKTVPPVRAGMVVKPGEHR